MIVVASHNRIDLLDNILKNLSSINLNNHDVLIVDTNSDNIDYKNFFQECITKYPNFIFETKDYTCWDSGAYIHAYKNYERDSYIFFQDSLTITNKNLIPMWDNFLKLYDVVPFINFGYFYDNDGSQEWSEDDLPHLNNKPTDSIFGPIFGVTKETMDKLPKEWLKEPTNKIQGCGMERRWSLMFHLVGASKHYIELTNFVKDHLIYNSKTNISKNFFHRL
jgi:hypothetical protein